MKAKSRVQSHPSPHPLPKGEREIAARAPATRYPDLMQVNRKWFYMELSGLSAPKKWISSRLNPRKST
jgi:hypothetical protein